MSVEHIIYRLPSWINNRTGDAVTLATEANASSSMRPLTLLELFQAAVAGGADPAELGKVWPISEYVRQLILRLGEGDLIGTQAMLATIPVAVDSVSLAAVNAVITANTLTAGHANWPEFDADGNPAGDPPATFTAQWVTDTLTDAGYVWGGGQWARA